MVRSTSSFDLRKNSSIFDGWMRPSWMSRSSVSRAISRRTGSKLLTTMVSGVSSITRSQPVTSWNVRMLRPSRPMMRPLSSSLGRCTEVTARSPAYSPA